MWSLVILRLGQFLNGTIALNFIRAFFERGQIFKCEIIFPILWNHFNSWGPMFMGNQNFAGSLGRNFVGN